MKKFIRITAVVLVFAMLSGMVGCKDSGASNSDSTKPTDSTTTASGDKALDTTVDWEDKADIDEIDKNDESGTGELYEAGKKAGTVKALCYYDLAETQPELAKLLAEKFGGTIETEISPQGTAYFDKIGTMVASGTSPDIVRYDWMAYPCGISKNMFTSVDGWLDEDAPLWVSEKDIIESFVYAGKHYYFPSNVSINFAMIYNRSVLDEAGLDDPVNLYKEGNWNWDTFKDMLAVWAQQGDDYIGFTGGSWTSMMFANSTGTKVIDMTGTEIINNMKSQNVQRTMDWLSELKKVGYVGEGFVDPGQAFLDGKLLFLAMGLVWGYGSAQEMTFKKGIESDIVALPLPKDPQSDKYYMSADTFGFMIPTGAKNIQGAIDWILSARIYETDPEIVAATRAKNMDTTPIYYPKCPGCKYDFTLKHEEDLLVCPECGAARKQKYKVTYSEEQMDILDDMVNPEKFTFIFDNSVGFTSEVSSVFTGQEESVFDGPLYYGSSYTQLRDSNYNVIESYLEPFRAALAEAVGE